MGARKSKSVTTGSYPDLKGRPDPRNFKTGVPDLNNGIPKSPDPEPDPRPKTVRFLSPGSVPGRDGLDLFDLNPSRRIKTLTEITDRCWYSLDLDLERSVSAAPAGRVGHALLPVPHKNELYMIGGGNKGSSLAQIWKIKYSGNERWKIGMNTCALSYEGRYNFLCGLDKNEDKIWMFGGSSASYSRDFPTLLGPKDHNDVSYIDLKKGQFHEVILPAVDIQCFGLLGGYSQQHFNQKPHPCSQGNNSCIVDLKGTEYLIVGGGLSALQTLFSNSSGFNESRDITKIFMFNMSTLTWTSPSVSGSIPPRVEGHGMVAVGSKVYLFGGTKFRTQLYEDFFFVIDLESPEVKWSKAYDKGSKSKPTPRTSHGMTAKGKDIYVFGGLGQQGSLSDLWKYDTETNEWTLIDPGMVVTQEGKKLYQIQPCHNMAMTILTLDMPTKNGEDLEKCDILVVNGGMNTTGQMFDNFWIFPLFIPNTPEANGGI